ncbi:hypothetical protein J4212_06435 [Candidatus Woesearchaeota archaeon]|nr:hypothetical protein [Candidatus Woesearchaeota archaeon]
MSHAENKVEWCLRKAEKELKGSDTHRGLVKVKPDNVAAARHIAKAEHYLKATAFLENGFSDISASTSFYAMYHSLLAIASKFGYESRNQECTFALMHSLIEDKNIDFDRELMGRITTLDPDEAQKKTSVKLREQLVRHWIVYGRRPLQ